MFQNIGTSIQTFYYRIHSNKEFAQGRDELKVFVSADWPCCQLERRVTAESRVLLGKLT